MKNYPVTEKILSSVNITGSRIIRFPNLIFLCGGKTEGEDKASSSSWAFANSLISLFRDKIERKARNHPSRRAFFFNHLKSTNSILSPRVLLAEPVYKAIDRSVYKDLLTFENDFASLCALTVVFAESPGSLAELGSFAVSKNIQDKLLVIMDKKDSEPKDGSFIWDGPITYLRDRKCNVLRDPCLVYPWDKDETDNIRFDKSNDVAIHLERFIGDEIAKAPKQRNFKPDDDGHIMLLITDLLGKVVVATLDELIWLLKNLGLKLPELDRKRMRQFLNILQSVGFITHYDFGTKYYCSNMTESFLQLSFHKTAIMQSSDMWMPEYLENYKDSDVPRFNVWKKHFNKVLKGKT